MNYMLLVSIFLPILAGTVLLLIPSKMFRVRAHLIMNSMTAMILSVVCAVLVIIQTKNDMFYLFNLVDKIPVYFHVDELGRLFAALITIVMFLIEIFSVGYLAMEHGEVIHTTPDTIRREKRYHGFYLIVFGVLLGLCYSGNLVTMYMFYELMTLMSVPLVFHEETREAIMAGLKYMIYSFCGAYMALFGIYFLYKYTETLDFTPGGTLNTLVVENAGMTGFMLVAVFLMILGFGVKAGMFPLHSWLPTAHPVAPAPASAALSGIIVKGGILAIIRTVYYIVGPDFIRATWVQYAWLIIAMITIILGSALAFKEKVIKKRFAYSTVSNLSYISLGLAFLNPVALTGAMLHVVFHAVIKGCLFLCAGYIIALTGKTKVQALKGMGKEMPVLFSCFTVAALGLIGMPPTCGLISKWYLATGALNTGMSVFAWLGPVVLLISALLTAGYLLSITILAFLNGDQTRRQETIKTEQATWMIIPIIIFAVVIVVLGVFPTFITDMISGIVSGLM